MGKAVSDSLRAASVPYDLCLIPSLLPQPTDLFVFFVGSTGLLALMATLTAVTNLAFIALCYVRFIMGDVRPSAIEIKPHDVLASLRCGEKYVVRV